jgi:hypothetical protein
LPRWERTVRCDACGLVLDREYSSRLAWPVAREWPGDGKRPGTGRRPVTPRAALEEAGSSPGLCLQDEHLPGTGRMSG